MAKPKSHKMGRPIIEIDWSSFDKLCHIQCTLVEISGFYGCSEDTIERAVKREKLMTFADYFKKKSAGGKMSLRRWQFDAASKGNTTMLIWLGKQYLGQIDQPFPSDPDADKDDVIYKTVWGSGAGKKEEQDT